MGNKWWIVLEFGYDIVGTTSSCLDYNLGNKGNLVNIYIADSTGDRVLHINCHGTMQEFINIPLSLNNIH